MLVKLIVGSQRNVAWRKSKYIFKDVSLPIVAPLRAIFGQISTFEFTVLSHFFPKNLRDALDNMYDARVPAFWRKVKTNETQRRICWPSGPRPLGARSVFDYTYD